MYAVRWDSGHNVTVGNPDAPAGPLDAAVFSCPGCGCLVVDQDVHAGVCGRGGGDVPPLGPQIVEWLDTLDADELWDQSIAESGVDASPAGALLDRLKRLAAAL